MSRQTCVTYYWSDNSRPGADYYRREYQKNVGEDVSYAMDRFHLCNRIRITDPTGHVLEIYRERV